MPLMQITVIPLETGSPSIGAVIAELTEELARSGATCQLNDMATVIEGTVEELFTLAARLHALPFARGVDRVVTLICIDERRDKTVHLGDKTRSVLRFREPRR